MKEQITNEQGWWQKAIARALGGSEGAVSEWIKRGREGGAEALKTRPRPGATPRLTAAPRAQVPALLARGADAWGVRGDVWTCRRIADVIWRSSAVRSSGVRSSAVRSSAVRSSAEHSRRLLQTAGWSGHLPAEHATQRTPQAIEAWYDERWPAIN
jgi:transposase